jgi:hypothetical protein
MPVTSVTAVAASAVMLASIVGLSVNNAHLLALAMLASTADLWASTLPRLLRLLLPLGSSGCAPGTSRPFDLIQYTTNSNKCFLQQRHLY